MGTAENKAVQRRIIDEVINQKYLDLADELFSEEHELHPEAPGVTRGPEGMKRAFAGLHEEFPDIPGRDRVHGGGRGHGRRTPDLQRYPRAHRRTGHVAGDGLRALLRGQGCGELGGYGYRAQLG